MTRRKSSQRQVLKFVGDEYEDLELWYPRLGMIEAGYRVVRAGQARHPQYVGKHGYRVLPDAAAGGVKAHDFLGPVIPGGWIPISAGVYRGCVSSAVPGQERRLGQRRSGVRSCAGGDRSPFRQPPAPPRTP